MFQIEQVSILIISFLIIGLIFYFNRQFQKLQAKQRPSPFVTAVIKYVEFISNYTLETMGPHYGPKFAAYIGIVFIYLIISNISGLFGVQAPTANYSVTLVLALITWLAIQLVSIKENGLKGYLAGFADPFAFFIVPNIFGTIAPLVSLSLRLFGNITAGSAIMSLFYMFTAWLSQFIPVVGDFNFVGAVLAPVFHLYFDLFSGFLQAFLFISLSMIFIGNERADA